MIRSPVMTVMTDAVTKAARSLKRDFGEVENLQVSRKGPGGFVSAADHKAEGILRDALQKARPGYGLVMEEAGVVVGHANALAANRMPHGKRRKLARTVTVPTCCVTSISGLSMCDEVREAAASASQTLSSKSCRQPPGRSEQVRSRIR